MEKERDLQNNAHPPVCLSAAPPWIGFPNDNWGTSLGPSFFVTLDPTRFSPADMSREHTSFAEMNRLLDEFADRNDDLLRELAR